jgi:hypothetical protein
MLEKDRDFFQYAGCDEFAAEALAERRANRYLDAAISKMTLEAQSDVDFGRDGESFREELTSVEVYLLALQMNALYLSGNIPPLAMEDTSYTGVELRVFDQSSKRSSFLEMLRLVQKDLAEKMDLYRSNDRKSNKYVSIWGA